MPNTTLMLQAQAVAALLAAAALLLCGWSWRAAPRAAARVGGVVGVGMGFCAGCWWLHLWPRWPPTEDAARLLFILLPTQVIVELFGALPERFRWVVWLLRLLIAAGAARLVLHDSTYLKETEGFDTGTWSTDQAWLILGTLAAALAGTWALLTLLTRRTPGHSVTLAVAFACEGAAVTIMYSESLAAGQMALPLAAALVGAVLATFALKGPANLDSVLSLGVVGLFALLVSGRFFSDLSTTHACLLFFAPLLCWLPELPYLCRLWLPLRCLLRVALTCVPIALVVTQAREDFHRRARDVSPPVFTENPEL